MKKLVTAMLLMAATTSAAQQFMPEIHGTIRGKYEYQTEEGEGRFEVRNARISVTGKLVEQVAYKAEIDLSDEGSIKMIDAYARIKQQTRLNFKIGKNRETLRKEDKQTDHKTKLDKRRCT